MLEKLKGVLSKLDGLKSVLGLGAVVAYYAAPNWGVHLPDAVLRIGSGLAGIGLAHKLEKGLGLFTKVLDLLTATKAVVDQTKAELDKKEGETKP